MWMISCLVLSPCPPAELLGIQASAVICRFSTGRTELQPCTEVTMCPAADAKLHYLHACHGRDCCVDAGQGRDMPKYWTPGDAATDVIGCAAADAMLHLVA